MIAAIRIKGMVKNKKIVDNTLFRLRLRRKYVCAALTHPTKEQTAMINNMKAPEIPGKNIALMAINPPINT